MNQTNRERTQLRPQTDSAQWRHHIGLRTKKWTSWLRRNESNKRLSLHCKFGKRKRKARVLCLAVSIRINEFILYGTSEWFYIFYSSALHAKTQRAAINSSNIQQFVCIPTEKGRRDSNLVRKLLWWGEEEEDKENRDKEVDRWRGRGTGGSGGDKVSVFRGTDAAKANKRQGQRKRNEWKWWRTEKVNVHHLFKIHRIHWRMMHTQLYNLANKVSRWSQLSFFL